MLTTTDVRLARRGAGTWTVEDVYTYGGSSQLKGSIKLALDKAGNPVVGHKDNTNVLRISRKTSSGWQHATVGTHETYDMALDSAGKVHIIASTKTQILYFHE